LQAESAVYLSMDEEALMNSDLELRVSIYESLSGKVEDWEVRLNSDYDLEIFKSGAFRSERTVRYRAGSQDLSDEYSLADYFLTSLKREFHKLLYLSANSSSQSYSGTIRILNRLPDYLSVGKEWGGTLTIGGKLHRVLKGFDNSVFFAKPK